MLESLGILLILLGTGGLAALGLYLVIPRRISNSIPQPSIEPENHLGYSPGPSRGEAVWEQETFGEAGRFDPGLADQVFAELFSLRVDVASIRAEFRAVREELEASGALAHLEIA